LADIFILFVIISIQISIKDKPSIEEWEAMKIVEAISRNIAPGKKRRDINIKKAPGRTGDL
jgi:hypothetical protein